MRNVKLWLVTLLMMVSTSAFGQAATGGNTYVPFPPTTITSPANNQCLVYQSSTNRWVNGSCASGGGATITGSPVNGNLAFFSGAGTISNGNLSGDCSTSGTGVLLCTKSNGVAFQPNATAGFGNSLPGTLSTTQNDYQVPSNVTGSTTRWILTPPSGGGTLTGMVAEADGFAREIVNASATDYIFFTCNDTNSTSANRAACVTTQALGPGMSEITTYVSTGWRL